MSGTLVHVDDTDELYSVRKSCTKDASSFGEVEHSPILPNIQISLLSDSNINEAEEVVLPNGDMYSGPLHDGRPQDVGKYVWSDGSIYEGEWRRGVIEGHGKMVWPSGAIYKGQFSGGYMHGIGTYTGSDNVTYRGEWTFSVKHGSGRKVFSNGDIFEGSWVENVIDGSGKYIWSSGNVYVGNMKCAKMSGKGIITWTNGDSFEGNWMGGLIHRFGVYTWVDGGFMDPGFERWERSILSQGWNPSCRQQLFLTALRKGSLMPKLTKQHHSTPTRRAASIGMGNLKLHKTMKAGHGSSTNLPRRINKSVECTHSLSVESHCGLEASVEMVTDHDCSTALEDIVGEIEEVDVAKETCEGAQKAW